MSSAERFVHHHKRQTNCAISEAYSRLATNPAACAGFTELLHCARNSAAGLLAAPVVDHRHLGVEALVNLARSSAAFVRLIASWPGSQASWCGAIASLAQHLIGEYPVPRFLAAAWYATDELGERKRQWFIAHGRGAVFRSLDLPMPMTRRMEHVFLRSHEHLGIEYAMRRAELLALGAPDELIHAVLRTRFAIDLSHGEFWRTVWRFLIANVREIDMSHVGPIIDFVQAIRHERVAIDTPDGLEMREPPQPSFSMKGRTVHSVLRLMQDWHRGLGLAHGGLTWPRSRLRPMVVEEPTRGPSVPPTTWHLTELTSSEQLRAEGVALRHCVASYSDRCWRGGSRIWSMRLQRGERVRSVMTVEVDTRRNTVIQARGFRNRPAAGKSLRLLETWAARENLRLTPTMPSPPAVVRGGA